MNNSQIAEDFNRDMEDIESRLLEIGGLVEAQVDKATSALAMRNTELAAEVVAGDKVIDRLEQTLNDKALNLLASRHLVSDDLRVVISALKISAILERVGDYAKNIAKRTSVLAQGYPVGSPENIISRMSTLVQGMISDVLDAFVARDLEAADEIRVRDNEVDLLHNSLFRELLTHMMEDPRRITPCMHLLFVAKNLERAGDHATGIAEQVHYLVTGTLPDDDRPKADKTSTISVVSDD